VLYPVEQGRVVQLLVERVERVEYDGSKKTVRIRFQPTGIHALSSEIEEAKTVQLE
jgi:hypothetical protein